MAEWMTGAMLMDKMAIDFLAGALASINSEAGKGGCVAVFMPIELSAIAQPEVQETDTGATVGWSWPSGHSGGGGGGDVYPI